MGNRQAVAARAAQHRPPAGPQAATTEPARPHSLLGPGRFVSPAATAGLLGQLAHGRQRTAALQDLQRYRGNRYVGGVLQAMREGAPGPPGDRWEQEADRVAGQVTSPAARPAAQLRPSPLTRSRSAIQRSAGGGPGADPGPAPHQAISSARGSGRPIPAPVRAPLERSLDTDFSAVRVHTDSGADQLALGMGAVAFTTGQDIFFRRGRYDPDAQAGRRLLAHELTHVVQQQGMAAPGIQRKMGLEYEVDDIRTRHTNSYRANPSKNWVIHDAGDFMMPRTNYDITADIATGSAVPYSRIEFKTRAFDETQPAEVANMITAVNSILSDIAAIKAVSYQHSRPGYFAGNKWLRGGDRGWLAYDEWVGLNEIPRLRGPWYEQVIYAGQFHKDAVGTLQLTGGFSLPALQRLVSGQQLGSLEEWPQRATAEPRQYLHGYARQARQSPQLYRWARAAVDHYELSRGGGPGSGGMMAAVLTVMAQLPLSQRAAKYDLGNMIAKTDYAKILSMARDEGMQFGRNDLLQGLLAVVNAHLTAGNRVNADSPVIPDAGPPDLSKVSFRQWIEGLMPSRAELRGGPGRPPKVPTDLMTKASYPGTQGEKGALRAFGPYRHADPGQTPADRERAIIELRSIMPNPSADLNTLVNALVTLMHALHQ